MTRTAELEVVITPTYSGCPAMGQIEDDVRAALAANDLGATVVTRLAPAWTTDWISRGGPAEAARLRHRAAPHSAAGQRRAFRAARSEPPSKCPAPAAALADTTETSHFSSTACKALYKCLHCLEPFDYFKPY